MRTSLDRKLGGAQPGNRVSFVRAYARSGCLVELELNVCWLAFSLFPFCPEELSLFPFGALSFPFSLPPPPQTPYPTLIGPIGNRLIHEVFLGNMEIWSWLFRSGRLLAFDEIELHFRWKSRSGISFWFQNCICFFENCGCAISKNDY